MGKYRQYINNYGYIGNTIKISTLNGKISLKFWRYISEKSVKKNKLL